MTTQAQERSIGGAPGGGNPPEVTLRQLRELVETASGQRVQPLAVVDDGAGKVSIEPLATTTSNVLLTLPANLEGAKPHFQIRLPDVDRTKLKNPPPSDDFGDYADAVFWSIAAIEKFVLPYYAQFTPLDEVAGKLSEFKDNPDVHAFIHLPDSETVDGQTFRLAALVQSKTGQLTIKTIF